MAKVGHARERYLRGMVMYVKPVFSPDDLRRGTSDAIVDLTVNEPGYRHYDDVVAIKIVFRKGLSIEDATLERDIVLDNYYRLANGYGPAAESLDPYITPQWEGAVYEVDEDELE